MDAIIVVCVDVENVLSKYFFSFIFVDLFVKEWKAPKLCWTRLQNGDSLEIHIDVRRCDDSERLRHGLGIYYVGSAWKKLHVRIIENQRIIRVNNWKESKNSQSK